MQLEETLWGELSESSRHALRWAGAMAFLRADRAGLALDTVEADEFDVLVGTMLSHPGTSEARQLLTHVGASAADVLPPDYPLPSKDLARYSSFVPADRPPELNVPAGQAVQIAARELRGGAKVVELKALFGGLLYGSNRLASTVRDLLAGVGLTGAVENYRRFAEGGFSGSYGEFLSQFHPFRLEPVEVPDYKADKSVIRDDFVDIRAEVDAFAYLLASKSLNPPLAVGLFGDWGSGKTFFMESVQDRITQLVGSKEAFETAQASLPFWKQIVQINFNAWHYVEGDLWASLVDHVFSELRVAGDKGSSELAKRQKHWLDQIEARRRKRIDITGQIKHKKQAQTSAQRELQRAQTRKRTEEQRLEQLQQDQLANVRLGTSKKTAKKALTEFADQLTEGTASETLDAIGHARTQLQRGTSAFGAYPWSRRTLLIASGALLFVPALVLALAQVEAIPVTAQVFAGVSAALAVVSAGLRSVTSWAKSRLDELDKAEAAVRADIEKQRATLAGKVEKAASKVADANTKVEELYARDRVLEREIAALEARAKSVTSGQILGEFVAERVGSADYRELLGTAALIQRDFRELSQLIEEQNEEFLETDKGGKPPKPEVLNRIILYIDDLDRCEPEQVIEVLQAVHLLLAFPLFVVVVAVDSRWLAHSLAQHYPALTTSGKSESPSAAGKADGERRSDEDEDHATPSDYLEKIFQVPFWIEPLGETARKALVRGLLQGNLAQGSGAGDSSVDAQPLDFSGDAEAMVQTLFGRARAARLQTAALTVTPAELTYLDELAPLLGETPRSIKRFVNVYQLLCALPVPPEVGSPLYEEAVGFLLALTDGMPALYAALDRELESANGKTLSAMVTKARATLSPEDMRGYTEWAKDHPAFVKTRVEQLAEPARRVRRFTFHS